MDDSRNFRIFVYLLTNYIPDIDWNPRGRARRLVICENIRPIKVSERRTLSYNHRLHAFVTDPNKVKNECLLQMFKRDKNVLTVEFMRYQYRAGFNYIKVVLFVVKNVDKSVFPTHIDGFPVMVRKKGCEFSVEDGHFMPLPLPE